MFYNGLEDIPVPQSIDDIIDEMFNNNTVQPLTNATTVDIQHQNYLPSVSNTVHNGMCTVITTTPQIRHSHSLGPPAFPVVPTNFIYGTVVALPDLSFLSFNLLSPM